MSGWAWLGKNVSAFGPVGWPEAILFGIGVAIAVSLTASVAMLAWRALRPLAPTPVAPVAESITTARDELSPPLPAPFVASGLYVAEVNLNVERLITEHVIEMAFRYFNGTGRKVVAFSLSGHVRATSHVDGVESEIGKLPVATALWERGPVDPVPQFTESMVVVEQPIRPSMVPVIQAAILDGQAWFYFTDVNIMVRSDEDTTLSARLPLWEAATLSTKDKWQQTGRVVFARMAPITLALNFEPQ